MLRILLIFLILIVTTGLVWGAYNILSNNDCSGEECIASVNGNVLEKRTLESEVLIKERVYKADGHNLSNYKNIASEVREEMIEIEIIESYAQEKGIDVADEEIEERYKLIAVKKQIGSENPKMYTEQIDQEFVSFLKNKIGINKQEYMQKIELEIVKEKIKETLDVPFAQWLSDEKSKSNIKRS